MSGDSPPPDFSAFTRWLARREKTSIASESFKKRLATLQFAAERARDETLRAAEPLPSGAATRGEMEVLQLLAAADKSENVRPPELTTARGFRVTLAYDEGTGSLAPSICVLVHCPTAMIGALQGETVYLWNGNERFELGKFDPDGKAIGVLPAGIEISLSDFALGKVKLEEPPPLAGG